MRVSTLALALLMMVAACTSDDETTETTNTTQAPDPTETTVTTATTEVTQTTQASDDYWWECGDGGCALVAPGLGPDYTPQDSSEESPEVVACWIVPGLVVAHEEAAGDAFEKVDLALDGEVQIVPEGAAVFRVPEGTELDTVDGLLAAGVLAAPLHILAPAQVWKYGPVGEPTILLPDQWPSLNGGYEGEPAVDRIVVIDTGAGDDDSVPFSDPNEADSHTDPLFRGHGVFAASVAETASAGLVDVELRNGGLSFDPAIPGGMNEANVVAAMKRAGVGLGSTDVVNISAGTYPCRARDVPLLLAGAILDVGSTIVAAAGNDARGPDQPFFFPAGFGVEDQGRDAFVDAVLEAWGAEDYPVDYLAEQLAEIVFALLHPAVVSVGALEWDGSDAPYSNWSEVTRIGSDVVGYHPDGTAVWSGTSFAAPNYAGCLALGAC